MVDVAPQGETLAALAEVATEADALGVTANPGETVAEVRVAEGEAPGPGGEGRTNAPEPERETRRRPPNPSAPPPRRRSSAPVVQARDDRGAPVRWVLGGVILGLALSGLSPEYSEPANSPEVHAHRDGADSPMAPGGFLPFGFRASAANRAASRDASAEEVIPFGGVPRTAEDARAALETRRSNRPIHPNTLYDEASEKVRVGSLRDRLARWVTSVIACASLFLPMSRSMARWPTPAFLLGVVAIVVFALSVNNALDVTANGSGWTRRHDQSPGVVLGTPLGTQGKHADIVAKIEVSNGPDGVIRVGAPTSRTTSRTNGVPRDGGLKSRHHDVVTADSRRLASWGCEELTLWLKSEAGDWAGAYRERMCRLGMNADLLLTAEDADLRADLGVTSRMHRRALLAAAGKLRETLAHAAVRGDDAAAKVWIGRLDGDGPNDDAGADVDDPGVKPPSMDQSSMDSDSGYVLPGAIASLSRWRSVAPVHRTAQILGVANCPRLRMLRDVTIGDGSLAALAGIARLDGNGARALDKSLLVLWFISPGVLVTLRSHELWGLGSPAGGFGVVLGFALVAMWCHGMLEIATRFGGTAGVVSNTRVGVPNTRRRPQGGGRRSIAGEGLDDEDDEDDSSDAGGWSRDAYPFSPGLESAAYLVLTRCVYPGAARALMLEAASLTMHATHSCLVDAVFIVGGVGLPLSRVGYRCWYVSSRGRGSQFWSDLRHVVRARVGLGGSGDARGGDDLRERARGPREAWASGDDWAEIAYGYAREDDEAINNSSAADEAADTSIMVDDIAVSNEDRSSEETRGGDGRRRDTVDADQVRAMTVEAMERIIFGPVGDLDRSLDVLEDLGRGHTRGTDGQGANTRDAGTGAGSVTTHTTATATGVGAGVAAGTETVLLARDVDRARSSRHSSSSSASRSHWPGPVQLPEWINEERAPSHFKCPITLCVMREPAVTPAGITYERSALMQWLDHQHVEPSTKRRLKRSHVVPNLTLRAMIEDWLQHERDVRSGKSGGGGGVDGSSGGRIDNHGGLPPGAAAVLQADRDALRAVRQRMYAALKERAAMGVCYEEQRWEAYRENRNREEGDGTINPEGPDVEGAAEDTSGGESGSGSTSPERIRVLQSARVTGAHRTRLAAVFGPELPAEPSNQSAGEELTADPPGSLDATLDDAAMND
jgi:hypothetical protein